MTKDEFNTYCGNLAHTTHVVQWGGADVWKIGGKLFAIAGWSDGNDEAPGVTFKVSDIVWEMYKEADGVRPAPYLASRGMKWLQRTGHDTINDDELKSLIEASYQLVASGLTKKLQRELGFLQ